MKRRSFFKELTRQTLSAYQLDKTQIQANDMQYEVMSAQTKSSFYIVTDLKNCFELQDLRTLGNVIFSEDLSINFQELKSDNHLFLTNTSVSATAPTLLWQPEKEILDKIDQSEAQTLILLHWFTEQSLLEKVQKLALDHTFSLTRF